MKFMIAFALAAAVSAHSRCENGKCRMEIPEDEVSLIQAKIAHQLGKEEDGQGWHSIMAPIPEEDVMQKVKDENKDKESLQKQRDECNKRGKIIVEGECVDEVKIPALVSTNDCSERIFITFDGYESQCVEDSGKCIASPCSPEFVKAAKMMAKCKESDPQNFWSDFGKEFIGATGDAYLDALGVDQEKGEKKACPKSLPNLCAVMVGCCDGCESITQGSIQSAGICKKVGLSTIREGGKRSNTPGAYKGCF